MTALMSGRDVYDQRGLDWFGILLWIASLIADSAQSLSMLRTIMSWLDLYTGAGYWPQEYYLTYTMYLKNCEVRKVARP